MKLALVWMEVCLLGVLSVLGARGQEVAVEPRRPVEPETPTKAGPIVAPPQVSAVRLLRYSAVLKDGVGAPRTGVVGLTFALYAEPEGGAPLWVETQNVTLDEQGRYTALLGITSNDGLPLEMFSTEEARWLAIQVQGEPEQTRVLLVSVPYALKALDAETLGGKPLSAFVLAEPGEGAASGTETGEAPIEEPKAQVGGSGTTNMVAKFTAAETLGDSQIFDDGTNVGIGTTNPIAKLHVNGNIRLIGQTTHQVQVTGVASSGRLGQDLNGFFFASDTAAKSVRFLTRDGGALAERVRITGSGNVGIGTASPAERLHVVGNFRLDRILDMGTDPCTVVSAAGRVRWCFDGTKARVSENGGPFVDVADLAEVVTLAWSLTGNASTNPAMNFLGTTDNQPLELRVNNARALRLEPGTTPNVIGGFGGNTVTGGVVGATIGGGGAGGSINLVNANFGTVGGGRGNTASAIDATVAGGVSNTASGSHSTVGGGEDNAAMEVHATVGGGFQNNASNTDATVAGGHMNAASNERATVGGGIANTASGVASTVPGGQSNTAQGSFSFAAGRRAKANHQGAFVWGDSTDADVTSTAANQFTVRATGGFRMVDAASADVLKVGNDGAVSTATDLFLNFDGPDGPSSILFFDGNSPTGESLTWEDSEDRFVFTSSLATNGTEFSLDHNGPDTKQSVCFFDDALSCDESLTWNPGPDEMDGFTLTDDLAVAGNLSKAGGSFLIDHPLDPTNKYLRHSFVESPDMKNVYDGVAVLDARGDAVVALPEWFEALNRDFRYQLTPIGAFAAVYIAEEIAGNQFKISGGQPGTKVSWQVTGVRQDAYANVHRIQVEEEKPATERGTYLHPEAFGKGTHQGVEWARAEQK